MFQIVKLEGVNSLSSETKEGGENHKRDKL